MVSDYSSISKNYAININTLSPQIENLNAEAGVHVIIKVCMD